MIDGNCLREEFGRYLAEHKATRWGMDAAPECTCAAKDMTFGRCCKVTPNAELNGGCKPSDLSAELGAGG